ncbi:extracellular solute-binding protein [Seminavis robusta]|uniref:Extracellular solute-binding protein n=1 Tax=Seminavis robusta TaxID=568900 RepID=A0A9N8HCX7_9STRA|nr:extracellular solute-binding protein [Seminavis robusta]|eukprot:Sro400_g135110.1 extracellular solute-binding protein (961) ;mRNA; r:35552-38511
MSLTAGDTSYAMERGHAADKVDDTQAESESSHGSHQEEVQRQSVTVVSSMDKASEDEDGIAQGQPGESSQLEIEEKVEDGKEDSNDSKESAMATAAAASTQVEEESFQEDLQSLERRTSTILYLTDFSTSDTSDGEESEEEVEQQHIDKLQKYDDLPKKRPPVEESIKDYEARVVGTKLTDVVKGMADADLKLKQKMDAHDNNTKMDHRGCEEERISCKSSDLRDLSLEFRKQQDHDHGHNNERTVGMGVPISDAIRRRTSGMSLPGAVPMPGLSDHSGGGESIRNELGISEISVDMTGEVPPLSRPHAYDTVPPPEEALLSALLVEDNSSELEARVRQQIMLEAVEACEVTNLDSSMHSASTVSRLSIQSITTSSNKYSVLLIVSVVLVVVMLVALAVGVAVGLHLSNKNHETENPIATDTNGTVAATAAPLENLVGPGSTMAQIRQRGLLRCGVYDSEMLINVEHCRAVALALLDDPEKFEIVITQSWQEVANGTVDFLAMATHTMGRDIWEPSTEIALQFTVPFLYTGMAYGGEPTMVECAENKDTIQGDCRQLRICVGAWSTHVQIVEELLPATYIVPVEQTDDFINFFIQGECNVMARDAVFLSEEPLRDEGYTGPYAVGRMVFSREPLGMVSRRGEDTQFSDLLNAVIQVFYNAESRNFTQAEAVELLDSPTVAEPTQNSALFALMVRLVAEFGHYGELYERTMEDIVPRDGLNLLHRANDGGLLYYFPFGDLDALGPDPLQGSTLATILERGHLICGVVPRRGFAESQNVVQGVRSWQGFSIEFCKALNAAIHLGETDTVEIVDVTDDRFAMLESGKVDVIAGVRVTMQKDVEETSTMAGFTFSTPIFHDRLGDSYALVTSQEDGQWSAFVHWVVMATIYAETEGVSNSTPFDMPTVSLFGQQFKQMFLDCIAAVGSYGEIYERTLEDLIPRSGGNLLNDDFSNPQVYAVPFN